jgi:hypothetical protein
MENMKAPFPSQKLGCRIVVKKRQYHFGSEFCGVLWNKQYRAERLVPSSVLVAGGTSLASPDQPKVSPPA